MNKIPRVFIAVVCGAALLVLGSCATHLQSLKDVREPLRAGDVSGALANFLKKKEKRGDLLYLLERAHLHHLNGQWKDSNVWFELAEAKADELYTKSISKNVASLVTSDRVLPYSSPLYEMSLIPFYRALNYMRLGQVDEALVEARKANSKLSAWSGPTAEKNIRPMAFLNYVTGLLYASAGDWENALVSYRDAYRQYTRIPDLAMPATLPADYYLAARKTGMTGELKDLVAQTPSLPGKARTQNRRNVLLFIEDGFSPHKAQVSIHLPVLETKPGETAETHAHRYVSTYGDRIYTYRREDAKLKAILRIAFPALVPEPGRDVSVKAGEEGSSLHSPRLLLDLDPAAREEFDRQVPGILLKTLLRALAKEGIRHESAKAGSAAGWMANILNMATEQADTRSWLFLPRRFRLVKLTVPPGETRDLTVRLLDPEGGLLEERNVPVTVGKGETKWLSVRFFQ